MKSIVYTSIIGERDELLAQPNCGARFIAYLDSHVAVPPWEVINVERKFAWPRLEAKRYKILPHETLPEHDYSLWIDGRVVMKEGVTIEYLASKYLRDSDIAMFAHNERTCIYEEAWECRKLGLDDADIIYDQVARYTRDGYPSNNGLHEASVVLRRNNERMRNFNNLWWEEILSGSIRDQLCFDYLAWKNDLTVTDLPGDLRRKNPYLTRAKKHSDQNKTSASSMHVTVSKTPR